MAFNAPLIPVLRNLPGVVSGTYGAGGAVTIKPGVGPEYQNLMFRCFKGLVAATVAEIASSIQFVQIIVSGSIVMQLSGDQLVKIGNYYNAGCNQDGLLFINFARLWMRDAPLESAYGTADQSSFVVNVQFSAGNVITRMETTAQMSAVSAVLGSHVEYRVYNPNISGTGPQNWADFATKRDFAGTELLALHLFVNPADFVNFKMTLDQSTIIDADAQVLNGLGKLSTPIRTPQANMVTVDFTRQNVYGGAVPLNYDACIVEFNFSNAPGQFAMVAEFAMRNLGGNAAKDA